jgi:uncharacterized membrane protein
MDTIDKPFFTRISADDYATRQAKVLLSFAGIWVLLTLIFALLAKQPFNDADPASWLLIVFPAIGTGLFFMAYQHYKQLRDIGKPSVHLAKTAFKPNEAMHGFIEFSRLEWNERTTATTHVGLIKTNRLALWSTQAETTTSKGSRGIRVAFSTGLFPMLDYNIHADTHQWMVYIDLNHDDVQYKFHVPIPVQMGE